MAVFKLDSYLLRCKEVDIECSEHGWFKMKATIEALLTKIHHSKRAQLSSTYIKSVAVMATRMKCNETLKLAVCGNLCELVSLIAIAVPCL